MLTLALALVMLHGLDGQPIFVNPHEIVSVRAPTSELLHENVNCSIQTADGRLINVVDTCAQVMEAIKQ